MIKEDSARSISGDHVENGEEKLIMEARWKFVGRSDF